MTSDEFKDKGLLDTLKNLRIQKFKHGSKYAVIAPTWLINPKLSLEDFLDDFDSPKTKASALRDYASLPSSSISPFFKNPKIVDYYANPDRVCPIKINHLGLFDISNRFVPLAGVRYYFASDLSVSRDRTGIALCHREFFGNTEVYVIDFSFQITAAYGDTIDYEIIRKLIRDLKLRGFKIAKIGFDQFQSHDSYRILGQEGFSVDIVNYHESLKGCGFLYDLLHDGKLVYGRCDIVFIGESKELQVKGRRIDHLTSGGYYNSKDVFDAVVNALVLCSQGVSQFIQEFVRG